MEVVNSTYSSSYWAGSTWEALFFPPEKYIESVWQQIVPFGKGHQGYDFPMRRKSALKALRATQVIDSRQYKSLESMVSSEDEENNVMAEQVVEELLKNLTPFKRNVVMKKGTSLYEQQFRKRHDKTWNKNLRSLKLLEKFR